MKRIDSRFNTSSDDGDDNSEFKVPINNPFQDRHRAALAQFEKERERLLIGVLEKMFDKVPTEVEIANHCHMQMIEGTGHCMLFFEDQPVLELRDVRYDQGQGKVLYSWNDLTGKD